MKHSEIDFAYEYCLKLARSHYENFPVASVLLPAPLRKHIAAVYAIARMGDDVADEVEPGINIPERLAQLALLDDVVDGKYVDDNPIFVAVQNTIKEKQLSPTLFHRLFEAFRRDVIGTTAMSAEAGEAEELGTWNLELKEWNELLEYCSFSANPVGELVLTLAGDATPESISYSNDVCTALQITNFLQDRELDLSRKRNYLPLGTEETIVRTREMFVRGRNVVKHVKSWRLRMELKVVVAGGRAMLGKIEKSSSRKVERENFRNPKPKNENQIVRESEKPKSIRLGVLDLPRILWMMFR